MSQRQNKIINIILQIYIRLEYDYEEIYREKRGIYIL